MSDNKQEMFAELYASARQKHPSIVEVDADMLASVDEELKNTRRAYNTRAYIVITVTAMFLLATYPILLVSAFSLVVEWQKQLSIAFSQRLFLVNHPGVIIAAALIVFAVPMYTIFMPSRTCRKLRIVRVMTPDDELYNIGRSRFAYVTFAITLNYILVALPLLFARSFNWIPKTIFDGVVIGWLMIPMLVIMVCPAFILLFCLGLVFLWRKDWPREATRPTVLFLLAELIHICDERVGRIPILKRIFRVAGIMQDLNRQPDCNNGISDWSNQQMKLASDNFLSLAAWVYFPQAGTIENLTDRLCKYFNVFLTGYYHELPREEICRDAMPLLWNSDKSVLRKTMAHICLALYMGLPIAVLMLIVILFKIEIPLSVQPLLGILYVVWVTLGVLSYADRLSPDAKTFAAETMKLMIGRK